MDFFTHFLAPFIILSALISKNKLVGGFGGISIDFDTIFIAWIGFLAPYLFVFSHRGITHTFIFAAITSTLFFICNFQKTDKWIHWKTNSAGHIS